MLTGFQVATGAYATENWELILCESCFDRGDDYCRPVSNYELDEYQSDGGYAGEDGHADDCYCSAGVYCEGCGAELREAFVSPPCVELQEEEVED